VGAVWGEKDFFKNFEVKCRVLCIFIAKNYIFVARNTGPGGLVDPWGLRM